MRQLLRGRPRARNIRPAEPYLARGAREARRLRHNYVGTEHVLLVLVRDPHGGATRVLSQLSVSADAVERSLACWLVSGPPGPKIDPEALAALGIDLDRVREHVEETFGAGALEQTNSSCLGVCPRLKRALGDALDRAGDGPLCDEHVLLGMLSVPDSVAARVLGGLGVSLETPGSWSERPGYGPRNQGGRLG